MVLTVSVFDGTVTKSVSGVTTTSMNHCSASPGHRLYKTSDPPLWHPSPLILQRIDVAVDVSVVAAVGVVQVNPIGPTNVVVVVQ